MMRASAAWSALALACALSACAHYTGSGRPIAPDAAKHEAGWLWVDGVPLIHQQGKQDCGAAALDMVLAYWGRESSAPRAGSQHQQGYSAEELRDHARGLGLSAYVVEGTLRDIQHELAQHRPVIVGMAKPTTRGALAHYEVVIGLHVASERVATLDPSLGVRQNSLHGFAQEWVAADQVLLIVLGAAQPRVAVHPRAQ